MEKKEKGKGKGVRSESAEIITLKELCRQKEFKGPSAKEPVDAAVVAGPSTSRVVAVSPPKMQPKFVSIKIKEAEVDNAKDNVVLVDVAEQNKTRIEKMGFLVFTGCQLCYKMMSVQLVQQTL